MSRYDHFRQWLKQQAPRPNVALPPAERVQYGLPQYRLPPPPTVPPPLWVDPQGMAPPIFPPEEFAPRAASPATYGGVRLPSVSTSRAIASASMPLVRSASLTGTTTAPPPVEQAQLPLSLAPSHQSVAASPRPVCPVVSWKLRACSYGLVALVWLLLLGLGGYALTRLLDPVFAKSPAPTPERSSQASAPPRVSPSVASSAIAPPVPAPFDYADVSPRPQPSPLWALIAIITASALGSRLMRQPSRHSRHR